MKLLGALLPTLLATGVFVGIVYLAKYIIHRFLDHK